MLHTLVISQPSILTFLFFLLGFLLKCITVTLCVQFGYAECSISSDGEDHWTYEMELSLALHCFFCFLT